MPWISSYISSSHTPWATTHADSNVTVATNTHTHNCKSDPGTHGVDLVQDLPLLVRLAEGLGRLDGSLHLAGPHLEVADVLRLDEVAQLLGKLNRETSKCTVSAVGRLGGRCSTD